MYVVTGDEMHRIDRYAMDEIGLKEELLMENAGQAFFHQLKAAIDKSDRIAVLIGSGNNGGDGFVISRLLKEAGYFVDVWLIPDEDKIRATALIHKNIFEKSGHSWTPFSGNEQRLFQGIGGNYDVIVDALLGTGLKGSVRAPYDDLIQCINEARGIVFSVDIPSGLPSQAVNEGEFLAVEADDTYTFQAHKLTAFDRKTAHYYGEISVLNIGIPSKVFEAIGIKRSVITEERVSRTLAVRDNHAHKGSVGKVLVAAGSYTMPGAAVLATNACLRAGAGLTRLATPTSIFPIISSCVMEATFLPRKDEEGELSLMDLMSHEEIKHAYDCIAIGPGLGRKREQNLFSSFKDVTAPLLMDADALYHLAGELAEWKSNKRAGSTIITPHLGEMSLLTGISIKDIEEHRYEISAQFAKEHDMYVVLKGAHTLITAPSGEQWINCSGNPSLAKGGSGDVLTGIIAAFLPQHDHVSHALTNAVHIHGKIADEWLKSADVLSLVASDLIERLPTTIQSYRYQS